MDDHATLPGHRAVMRHGLLVGAEGLEDARRILARSGDDLDSA